MTLTERLRRGAKSGSLLRRDGEGEAKGGVMDVRERSEQGEKGEREEMKYAGSEGSLFLSLVLYSCKKQE